MKTCLTCTQFNTNPSTKERKAANVLEPNKADNEKGGVCRKLQFWTTRNRLRCGGEDYEEIRG